MWKTLALGAGFALIASTTMAQAQPQCNERDNVLALLAKKYKETPIAAGVTNTGGLVEVLTDIKPAFPKYRRYSVRREGDSAIRIMKL